MGDIFVKILGVIDFLAGLAFLMLVFGIPVWGSYLIFCATLLFMKGLFVFGGDVLSWIDLFSAVFLILSMWFLLPSLLVWTSCMLLFAKASVSFI